MRPCTCEADLVGIEERERQASQQDQRTRSKTAFFKRVGSTIVRNIHWSFQKYPALSMLIIRV